MMCVGEAKLEKHPTPKQTKTHLGSIQNQQQHHNNEDIKMSSHTDGVDG